MPDPGARGSAEPTFVNAESGEVLGVAVSVPPKDWSKDQVLAQRQRWIDGGTQRLSLASGELRSVGPVKQELLASGDVLLSAGFESKGDEPMYVQRFVLISQSARAAHFVVSGAGTVAGKYQIFRPYFDSAVWP